ncbi:MAG: ATPase [Treponema sp.]|uniref:xylulokinase n=1 Tax=Treponema sp. TaxID=166 RepID=UPI00298DDC8B|nr:FGGY-family carbohydrate kinase [Treponema sp.]MBR5932492.1 ATPase [Treponema sp.]
MGKNEIRDFIENGNAVLGLEFGSTRIKAVLIDEQSKPIASGAFDWENSLDNGIWTYSIEEIHNGLATCYANLKKDVKEKFGVTLKKLKAMGISAMMHGYLAFDKDDNLLVPFRTWRNTITGEASEKLSSLFNYPIPERWSISHLYQAMLNKEEHVKNVAFFTTLAGYVHWKLTGKKVLGVGDASGMFPIDIHSKNYNEKMLSQFDELIKPFNFDFKLKDLLPEVLQAGDAAGTLTDSGAKLLDKEGDLESGFTFAPPEGDAGTGMVATNSVRPRTGNVSAGTSVFAMVVLEKDLSKSYSGKIDLVTTPSGDLTAMAHANNCTGEYDKWIKLFGQAIEECGFTIDRPKLYDSLLGAALKGDKDCGGCIPYNYISGESMTGLSEGRPLFVRTQKNSFTLANFMRSQLFTSLGALRTGMNILFDQENVKIDRLTGHGGFFKTQEAGLTAMASAMHTPISLMETAGEGGPWGMALLALYTVNKNGLSLPDWLDQTVFANSSTKTFEASKEDIEGFNVFFENYTKGLAVEKAAIENVQ